MIQWGNVAEWVGAVGTALAFLAALALLRKELDAANDSRRAREQNESARRREQASHVAAWIEDSGGGTFSVVLKNASPYPVFDVAYYVAEADNHVPDSDWRLVDTMGPGMDASYGYVSAGESIRGINLTFRDNAGIFWRRHGDGTLEEDPEPPVFC